MTVETHEGTGDIRTPAQAWEEMRRGNERFVTGNPAHPRQDVDRRAQVADQQTPARSPVRLQ